MVPRQSSAKGFPMKIQPECKHTKTPTTYLEHHEWMATKAKTHVQKRCPVCGLWAVWVPKAKAEVANPKDIAA